MFLNASLILELFEGEVRLRLDVISLVTLLLQTGGCGSILTSDETTARANSLQTSQLFVGLKLPTSICFGIYLLPNYGKKYSHDQTNSFLRNDQCLKNISNKI